MFAKDTESTRMHGDFYRLLSPFEGNETAWIAVSKDRKEAVFTYVRGQITANEAPSLVKLQGLDPALKYTVAQTEDTFGGDELMYSGILCRVGQGDAASLLYTIKAVEA